MTKKTNKYFIVMKKESWSFYNGLFEAKTEEIALKEFKENVRFQTGLKRINCRVIGRIEK